MTLKTSDNLLRKHQQSTEKEEERIVAATILFLSTESNICSLLYFGCSGDETTHSLLLFPNGYNATFTHFDSKSLKPITLFYNNDQKRQSQEVNRLIFIFFFSFIWLDKLSSILISASVEHQKNVYIDI